MGRGSARMLPEFEFILWYRAQSHAKVGLDWCTERSGGHKRNA